jgi:hypothetical protein
MKTALVLIAGLVIMAGCAGSKTGAAIDLSKYDVNNQLSTAEAEGLTATVYITTDPPGADVFMDGKYIGKANADVVYVYTGKHEITLIKGEMYFQKTLEFQQGSNQPIDIKLIENEKKE